MRRITTLLALSLAFSAPADASTTRIYGGSAAGPGEFPEAVGLRIGDSLCGGALIAARWVATAAHCLDGKDASAVTAVIGTTNLDAATAEQRFGIARAVIDPSYKPHVVGYDLALLQLNRPAPAGNVRVAQPGDKDFTYLEDEKATIAGWGLTDDPGQGGTSSTSTLRKVTSAVTFSEGQCAYANNFYGFPWDPATEFCAGADVDGPCVGDDGDPLFQFDPTSGGRVLIGVFRATAPKNEGRVCGERAPSLFTRLGSGPEHSLIDFYVPHVDFTAQRGEHYPGRPVKLTATASVPAGTGPFGGYDHLAWDLDEDGQFDDATDTATATVSFTKPGFHDVKVRGTTAAGDSEVRTRSIFTSSRSVATLSRRVYHLSHYAGGPRIYTKITVRRHPLLNVDRTHTGGRVTVSVAGHGFRDRGVWKTAKRPNDRFDQFIFDIPLRLANRGSLTVRLSHPAGAIVLGRIRKAKVDLKLKR